MVSLSKKIGSVIVVDISSKLTLLNVELKGRIKVSALKSVELTENKEDEIVLKSIQGFIQENNIRHKNAILRPSLDSLLIKRIQLPAVPENELPEAIKWQLKEDISFDLSKAVLDFSIIKKTDKEDGSKVLDIMCALAQEQEIKRWVLLLKQLGLRCLSVGLLPFGYEKIIKRYITQEKEKTTGILHLADDICFIALYKDSNLEFYRELPISVNRLKQSLTGVLVSDKGKIKLSDDEVDEVLFNVGIPQEDTVYKDKISSIQILSMLRPILERLAVEIKRSLTYYGSQFQGGGVDKILISGSAVRIHNLDKFLSKELPLSIDKLSLEDKIKVSSGVDSQVFAQKYASFGLALDYDEGISVLPYEFRTEKIEKLEKISLRWIAFITFLLLIVSFIFAKGGVVSYQKRLENAKLHLNVLSEVKDTKTKIDELNSFIMEVRNLEPPIGQMLKKLSNIALKGLFIINFSLDCDSKIGAITGFVKSVIGNPDIILTQFVGVMEDTAYFSEVTISSVEKRMQEDVEITEFSINFKLP